MNEMRYWAKKALEKCEPASEPVPLYWLDHSIHDSDEDWCYECAVVLMKYFNGETERPATVWEDEQIPDWKPAPDSVSIDGGWRSESDSTRFCNRCGRRLEFCPTDYFCKSELEHYENYPPRGDWRSFQIFLDAMDEYRSSKRDWYSRALELAERYLGAATE
jgi:ferredoxin